MSKNPAAYALIDKSGNPWCAYPKLEQAKAIAKQGKLGPYTIQPLDESTIATRWAKCVSKNGPAKAGPLVRQK